MEKSKYEKALDMACEALTNSKYCLVGCPIEKTGKCGSINCRNKTTWKRFFLKEVEKENVNT